MVMGTHLKRRDLSQCPVAGGGVGRRTWRALVLIELGLGQGESLHPIDSCSHDGLGEEQIECAGTGKQLHEERPLIGQRDA